MCPHKVDMDVRFDLSAVQLVAQHRRAAVEQGVAALAHSCACADAYCRLPACPKMKRVVIHTSICQRKNKGKCPICKQLIALCCYHAKSCKDMGCVVPFCNMVKQKVRRQRLLFERLRTARGLVPEDEPDEIDVNICGGVSGWRLVRIVSSPSPLDDADAGEGQAAVRQLNGSEDNDSGEASDVADNNNVGENNNDSSDASSDEGGSTEEPGAASSDEKSNNETPEEQTESNQSEE